MKTFTTPAQLTGYRSTADKGLSLTFHTQEMTAEETAMVAGFHQGFGYLLFKENAFKDADVPAEDAPEFQKTSSERLRNVMYCYWKQLKNENRAGDSFETWRQAEMERHINAYKSRLNPL